MPRKTRYTEQELINAVKNSTSYAGVLRKVGLVPIGGNYKTIQFKIRTLKIDASHFTGAGWSRGKRIITTNKMPIEELCQPNTLRSSHNIRRRLVNENILKPVCHICKIDSWRGRPISLELDHIDGDKYNNSIENLRILCPNCHSATSTYRHRSRNKTGTLAKKGDASDPNSDDFKNHRGSTPLRPTKYCKCNEIISKKAVKCKRCAGLDRKSYISWPPIDEILNELKTKSYRKLAYELNVSDNAIRKHLKRRGILLPKSIHRSH